MASFSDAAFSTSAFATTAWDFGSPSTVVSKTGTGGIDPAKKGIYKPTGLIGRPKLKAKSKAVQERLRETHEIAEEVRKEAEFSVESFLPIETMTAGERDFEIARLLHQRIRTEHDELLLLLLIAACA